MVNRIIDDVADAAERMVVPALVGGVEALLTAGRPRPVSGSSTYSSGPRAEGRSA
jgi:hypothetical protein